MADLVVRSRRTVLPDGERAASVVVAAGRIAAVLPYDTVVDAAETVDLADVALLPGLVDTHVHVNEPGRADWEGFTTATRAAAAGGVTTIVDMPLNSLPPTVDVAALDAKRAAASGQAYVDVAFWGGAVPSNAGRRRELHDAGVLGFKCFTTDSGVPEFPPLSPAELDAALAELAAFDGLLLVHAEDPGELSRAPAAGVDYASFVASRPASAETVAIAGVLASARRTGARVHVLHLSAADGLTELARARADGVRVTVETCPHYLVLAAEDVPDGATAYRCCPPIREAENREALWRALVAGRIDAVVSDHSPCPAERRRGDFASAWGGIASLQLGLPVVWTEARRRGHPLADVLRWTAAAPARVAGLAGKGAVVPGNDADHVAFAPDDEWTVDPAALLHRHPVTPYAGRALTGV
ncbi:MAG: allantoinase AllB, partial [Streptosporangiales bacterium]|nr:allantoinase AllB [Streptosporangiales bacterium]